LNKETEKKPFERRVTYSPSLTLPLTRACANHCLYYGCRKDGDGLLPLRAIQGIIEKAHRDGVSEILILSGEKADTLPEVRRDLDLLGMDSFVSWTSRICERLLEENLLPHVNLGTLSLDSLGRLRDVSASMGLMIEGVNPEINARIHPGKDLMERFETIESAGQKEIPFTTGILLGIGEKQEDRLAAISEIERIHGRYGHIQEIILQRYVPNAQSQIPPQEFCLDEMKEIVRFCKARLGDVSIQIPPNLDPHWEELIDLGIDDLGGMGSGKDFVNPGSPWPEIGSIAEKVGGRGLLLKKRLPIYPYFYKPRWYSEKVGRALHHWIEGNDEYRYYS